MVQSILNLGYFLMTKEIAVVDLFAGAGGLSEGFHKQNHKMVAYVEKDRHSCNTLLTRHIYWQLARNSKRDYYLNYLKGNVGKEEFYHQLEGCNPVINAEISKKNIPMIVKNIRKNMAALGIKNIDLFIGGPPCQAYSLIGRARDPYKMEKDQRNILYKYYVELLKEFNPKAFIFENVPGILNAGKGQLFRDVCSLFKKSGYKLEKRILDSSDFMVLQKRQRVILIGWKKDCSFKYPEFKTTSHSYTVKDIFNDLPPLQPGEIIERGYYIASEYSEYLKKMEIRKRDDILTQHITRPLTGIDRKIYKIAIKKWNEEKLRLRYDDLPEHLITHKNRKSFPDRFKVVAADLPYSHTVVAHISKDGHYYIYPDENQVRSLSVREAARLQSFPDDYYFEGPRTSILAQIGNAVPPLMAEKIAVKTKEYFL
jgi:DNA (cytosine-5)-methyltransferase 1